MRVCVSEDKLFLPCSPLLYHSVQDPSTDARDDKEGFYFQRSFDSLRSLRMTRRERASSLRSLRMTGGRARAMPAPALLTPRGVTEKKRTPLLRRLRRHLPPRGKARPLLFQIILEKAKTTLFAFSPYSEELHAGKVNLRGVYKRCALTSPRKEENPAASRTAPRGVVLTSRRSAGSSLPRNA